MPTTRAQLEREYAEATLTWVRDGLELTDLEIGRVLGVDRKTVRRWRERQSVPSVTHRRQLERLHQLRHLLETSFRSPEAGHRWLHTPAPGLGGRTPLGVLGEGELDAVIQLLGTLAAGAFR
jgi:uncharacterized protein (DUF2384 family)